MDVSKNKGLTDAEKSKKDLLLISIKENYYDKLINLIPKGIINSETLQPMANHIKLQNKSLLQEQNNDVLGMSCVRRCSNKRIIDYINIISKFINTFIKREQIDIYEINSSTITGGAIKKKNKSKKKSSKRASKKSKRKSKSKRKAIK